VTVAVSGQIDAKRLTADLRALGVGEARHLLVHCSMRSLGQVLGGPDAVLAAIREVIGPAGTVVVPTQTANNSTTSRYHFEAVAGMTRRQRKRYIEDLPGFDLDRTPSFKMGLLAEHVRRHPDSIRSDHPQTSFSAIGPAAAALMTQHALTSHLGDESPLGALYRADGHCLLMGVDYDKCTTLHLAEYRMPPTVPTPTKQYRCFVARGNHRRATRFRAIDLDDSRFHELGAALDDQEIARSGPVGDTVARLIPIRRAVAFAITWMAERRSL
jgi:aminoglycoside N3'-acetyltransferase